MAVLLCSFATDMNLKWHADPDMQYVSIIIVVFLSLFTAALLAAFVRVCYQAYQTQQKLPTQQHASATPPDGWSDLEEVDQNPVRIHTPAELNNIK